MKRDFLSLSDVEAERWPAVFALARDLKREHARGERRDTLRGKTVALVFEKASTRTRVSFEVGCRELGADVVVLQTADSQLGRGEPVEDTARVLSRYVQAILLRTFGDDRLRAFARAASVPVINGLSDLAHPVQVAADLFTLLDRDPAWTDEPATALSVLRGKRVAFVGDASCNMALSWIEASRLFGFELRLAAPEGYEPPVDYLQDAPTVQLLRAPLEAVRDVDVINTDVWTSMGQEQETAERLRAFAGYTVDAALLTAARPGVVVLHCLPAHRGEEISAEVLEGPHSVVWDQAENRLHVQKALMVQLFGVLS